MSPSNVPTTTAAGKLGAGYFQDQVQQFQQLNTMLQMLRAKAYNSVVQAIATGVTTPLTFDTEIYDIGNLHESVTNPTRFTAQATGLYLMVGQIGFPAFAGTLLAMQAMVNGVSTTGGNARSRIVPNAAFANRVQVTDLQVLSYGDYVEFNAFQDSGGNLNTDVAATWGSVILLSRL